MEPINSSDRIVRNIHTEQFEAYDFGGVEGQGQSVLQVDRDTALARGFFIYRMEPGAKSRAHLHASGEHFFILEGDLQDHDGYEYVEGDLVYLKPGTIHNSKTRHGCTLVVYLSSADYVE